MPEAVAAQIGSALGIVRPEALQAIVDGILPLRRTRRDRAADDSRTNAEAEADRRAEAAAAAPPTATASRHLRQNNPDRANQQNPSSPLSKNISVYPKYKSPYILLVLFRQRGARDRHGRGMGCGGRWSYA